MFRLRNGWGRGRAVHSSQSPVEEGEGEGRTEATAQHTSTPSNPQAQGPAVPRQVNTLDRVQKLDQVGVGVGHRDSDRLRRLLS